MTVAVNSRVAMYQRRWRIFMTRPPFPSCYRGNGDARVGKFAEYAEFLEGARIERCGGMANASGADHSGCLQVVLHGRDAHAGLQFVAHQGQGLGEHLPGSLGLSGDESVP